MCWCWNVRHILDNGGVVREAPKVLIGRLLLQQSEALGAAGEACLLGIRSCMQCASVQAATGDGGQWRRQHAYAADGASGRYELRLEKCLLRLSSRSIRRAELPSSALHRSNQ